MSNKNHKISRKYDNVIDFKSAKKEKDTKAEADKISVDSPDNNVERIITYVATIMFNFVSPYFALIFIWIFRKHELAIDSESKTYSKIFKIEKWICIVYSLFVLLAIVLWVINKIQTIGT